ncbi:hypothetical protein FJY94_05370 [Candidatus Kaiserbacteria bacterium]|nr:hypothetical protein [Candidatus Kaiserbacteria bacterium]
MCLLQNSLSLCRSRILICMRPGPKPKGSVRLEWSPDFAYAIGLLTADGCLSKDGRHIDLTSVDIEQALLYKKCLGIDTKISTKHSSAGNRAHCVQFSDVLFYQFLMGIGLSPAKSKTLTSVSVPGEYFRDFLRGYFDGDGSSYSYQDPVFPNSFRFCISFTSASPRFVSWLQDRIAEDVGVRGFVSKNSNTPYVQLKFAKADSVRLSAYMYYADDLPRLERKYLKIQRSCGIIVRRRGGEIGRHATFRS